MNPEPPSSPAAWLKSLALQADAAPCRACATLPSLGWESVPSSFDRDRLEEVGALYASDPMEATLVEYHPGPTRYWSADAPIAPKFFPYNRCTVWRCRHCRSVFLRYAEHGGYYEEERIRRVTPALVVDAEPDTR